MKTTIKNLVFEGGGMKGLAYLGAMHFLNERGILNDIERVCGTSAGAINAVLLGLNYSIEEISYLLGTLDFTDFLDDDFGIARDTKRLFSKFGWYRGDTFRNWIAKRIEEKTGNSESTFYDLHKLKNKTNFKEMYFIGTNLSTARSTVFSYKTTPNMKIADAVRISMSIPLFFASKRSSNGDVYVDGGVLNNYPIQLFDVLKTNYETLGFRLDTRKEIRSFRDNSGVIQNEITNIFAYTKALLGALLNAQQTAHLKEEDWNRTVFIDTLDVDTTDFDLPNDKKELLINSGYDGAKHYFAWRDSTQLYPD